jgi:hypothetical protein
MQKRVGPMSALLSKPYILGGGIDFRYVPKADIGILSQACPQNLQAQKYVASKVEGPL